MIFALSDFIQFVRRRGRYGDRQRGEMALAFVGTPPREVIQQLKPADVFFTQRLDAYFSWMTMYFSSSSVDHCGIYTGDGRVIHATYTVVSEDPLRYVTKGARVLLIRPFDIGVYGQAESRTGPRYFHRFPAKWQLRCVALEVVMGFYPERFRWKFLADLLIFAALIDLLLWPFLQFPMALTIAAGPTAIAMANQLRWLVRRLMKLPPPLPMSHPDLHLGPVLRGGGLIFTRHGPFILGPFGLLPLKVVQAIARQSSNDDESDEVRATRVMFRDMLKRLVISE